MIKERRASYVCPVPSDSYEAVLAKDRLHHDQLQHETATFSEAILVYCCGVIAYDSLQATVHCNIVFYFT